MINISDYTVRELTRLLRQQFGKYKNGRSRKAYLDTESGIVYKLPVMSGYNRFNEQELKNYHEYRAGTSSIPLAHCELFYTKDKVAVLVMDLVTLWNGQVSELPMWAKNGNVDSYQVGYDKTGTLVAFDHTTGA